MRIKRISRNNHKHIPFCKYLCCVLLEAQIFVLDGPGTSLFKESYLFPKYVFSYLDLSFEDFWSKKLIN